MTRSTPHRAGQSIAGLYDPPTCRSESSWWRTAARSPCGSSARAASSGSRPWRWRRPTISASLHARSADETVEIESYLTAAEHIRAAQRSGADAIHPGYGFLAENADFAEAVEAAGVIWVGPPAEALRLGGDKLAAKRIAAEAGVPVVPTGEPEEIGFPLLVKAAAGGGGRGMRVVREPAELARGARGCRAGGRGGVRGRNRLLRALRRAAAPRRDPAARRLARDGGRARRAGLLGAAAPPEGARGVPLPRARPGAARGDERSGGRLRTGDRLHERGHGRVHARRRRVLLPGAERPDPGRAPGHGAGDRHRPGRASSCESPPASDSAANQHEVATRSRRGSTPRIRRRSFPRPGRSSGCACRRASGSMRESRQATRSGSATTR